MSLRTGLAATIVLFAACGTSQVAEEPPTAVVVRPTTTETVGIVATTVVSTTTSTEGPGVVVVSDLVYYESEDGNALHLDVYRPSDGVDLPLVVLFHASPLFGGTKASVRDLATMMAERGAVVFAPSYGSRVFDPTEVESWFSEQGPCAVWTAVDMGLSFGADPGNLVLFGETTGSFPASTVFSPPTEAAGCVAAPVDVDVEAAFFFEQDWFFVPDIWDPVLTDDPRYFATIQPWDDLTHLRSTSIYILVGELSDQGGFDRSMQRATYVDSDWVRLRDPEGDLADAWVASGGLDDDRMSLTDVSEVFTAVLLDVGWDAQLVVVPGTGHGLNEPAMAFVVDLLFEEMAD